MDSGFWLGLCIIADEGAPLDIKDWGVERIVGTSYCIAVPVRHAQDVEVVPTDFADDREIPQATVAIRCYIDSEPENHASELSFDGVINCPTGDLTVGDADELEHIIVRPGSVRISIRLSPDQHADDVEIWVREGAT